jgi:hypothetical protein
MHKIRMKFQSADGNCGRLKNSQRPLSIMKTRYVMRRLLDDILESPRYKLKEVMCSVLATYTTQVVYMYEILIS